MVQLGGYVCFSGTYCCAKSCRSRRRRLQNGMSRADRRRRLLTTKKGSGSKCRCTRSVDHHQCRLDCGICWDTVVLFWYDPDALKGLFFHF